MYAAATRRLNGKNGQEKWGKHTCSKFGECYPEPGKKVLYFRASEERVREISVAYQNIWNTDQEYESSVIWRIQSSRQQE